MGKIAEKMKKAKTKANNKVAAKIGKRGKNAKECAKAAVVLVAFAALAILCGCATTGEQPARAMFQTNTFDKCIVIVGADKTTVSNDVVEAKTDRPPSAIELFTQTQANEGSETISPTATPTNTTDVDANLDIPITKTSGATKTACEAVKACADCEDGSCQECEVR